MTDCKIWNTREITTFSNLTVHAGRAKLPSSCGNTCVLSLSGLMGQVMSVPAPGAPGLSPRRCLMPWGWDWPLATGCCAPDWGWDGPWVLPCHSLPPEISEASLTPFCELVILSWCYVSLLSAFLLFLVGFVSVTPMFYSGSAAYLPAKTDALSHRGPGEVSGVNLKNADLRIVTFHNHK